MENSNYGLNILFTRRIELKTQDQLRFSLLTAVTGPEDVM